MRHATKAPPALLLALVFCALSAAEARADALVVTGGFGTSNGAFGGPFVLTGDGFSIGGETAVGSASFPAPAGALVNLGSRNSGSQLLNPLMLGFLHFDAPLVVPAADSELFVVTVPFTFTGHLRLCSQTTLPFEPCGDEDVIFDADLVGQGIATAVLTSFEIAPGVRAYSLQTVRYDFAAPTPEPATVVLLASGLAGVGAAARRRRRRSARDKSS